MLLHGSTYFYHTSAPVLHHVSIIRYRAGAFNILKLARIQKKKKKQNTGSVLFRMYARHNVGPEASTC